MDELVSMAVENKIAYEVITNAEDKARRRFTEIAGTAAKTYMVPDTLTQLENILVEAPRAVLFVLWDPERDDDMQRIVGKFVDSGVDTREWTDGLSPMGLEEEGEEEEPAPEPVNVQSTQVTSDGQGEEEPATELPIYSRTDLKELSMNDLKGVAARYGLPPRKARETMINEIMDAQGGEVPEEAPESPVEPEEPSEPPVAAEIAPEALGGLQEVLESFGNSFLQHLSDLLDEKLTDLGKTIEGVIFNMTPEPQAEPEPEPVPEQPQPRRLVRRR
jgi:hypothetical protein